MKLQHKSALLIFSIGTLFLLVASILFFYQSRQLAVENAQLSSQEIAEEYARHIEGNMVKDAHVVSTLANSGLFKQALALSNSDFARLDEEEREQKITRLNKKWMGVKDVNSPFIQSYMTNPVSTYLKDQQKAFPEFYGEIFLTNRYGVIIATTKKLTTLAHSQKYWWNNSYNEGKGRVFFDDRGYDKSVNGYVLGVVVPVKKGDEIIGILKCNIKILGPYSQQLNKYTGIKPGTMSLVRSRGLTIIEKNIEPLSRRVSGLLIEKMESSASSSMITTLDDTKQIISLVQVPITGNSTQYGFGGKQESVDQKKGNLGEKWFVILSRDFQEATAVSKKVTQKILFTGFVLILLMAYSAWLLGRRIARPITKLAKIVENINKDDFNFEVEVSSKDELSTLAKSFNNMLVRLQKTTTSRNKLLEEIDLRKQVEQEIRKREHQLVVSQAVAKLGNWELNLNTQKTFWSAETYRLFDQKPEEFSPCFEEFTRFIHPDDLTRFQTSFNNALKSEDFTHHVNIRIINDSGREWILEIIGKARWDINGKAVEMIGTAQDITESRRIEEKIIFLSHVSRQVSSSMITTNKNFEINWVNEAFEKLYGYTEKEVIGKTPDFLNAEQFVDDIQNDIYQTVSSGKNWKGEALNKRKDGSIFPCEFEVTALMDEAGEIFSYVSQLKNITERKKAEEILLKAHEELEIRVEERTQELKITHDQLLHSEKLSAIGGLSASIAHEFNNPLQGVMNVIKGVKRRVSLEDEESKLIDMAINECDRMKDLIRNLQDFNRPSSRKTAPVDIHTTINSILILSKKEYEINGITVVTHYAENMVMITGVADQIKQVLLNLLNNAAYACEGDGTIAIYTKVTSKENITIEIQDSGKGIKSEHMNKIFDPFFTTKPEIKGTGLGLSVSYGIIKNHGGRIDVSSEPGRGTVFTITLPVNGVRNA